MRRYSYLEALSSPAWTNNGTWYGATRINSNRYEIMGQGMRLLINVLRVTLALCVVASISALAMMAYSGGGVTPVKPPLLDSTRANTLGIELDVDGYAVEGSTVTRDAAVEVARSVHALSERVEVYHGRAWRYQGELMRSVWIVVTDGGRSPSWGPPGGEPLNSAITGVIVDDATGEFVRGFLTSP